MNISTAQTQTIQHYQLLTEALQKQIACKQEVDLHEQNKKKAWAKYYQADREITRLCTALNITRPTHIDLTK